MVKINNIRMMFILEAYYYMSQRHEYIRWFVYCIMIVESFPFSSTPWANDATMTRYCHNVDMQASTPIKIPDQQIHCLQAIDHKAKQLKEEQL